MSEYSLLHWFSNAELINNRVVIGTGASKNSPASKVDATASTYFFTSTPLMNTGAGCWPPNTVAAASSLTLKNREVGSLVWLSL
jgi:hypothetical protein